MAIPDPYFRDVPDCGDLRLERVLEDYDYPLLSVLRDHNGNRYLCLCFDTRGAQQWLIAPISATTLAALLRNEVPLDFPYTTAKEKVVHAVLDYRTREETFRLMEARDIPREYLPAPGGYLDAGPGEWTEYIAELTNMPSDAKKGG